MRGLRILCRGLCRETQAKVPGAAPRPPSTVLHSPLILTQLSVERARQHAACLLTHLSPLSSLSQTRCPPALSTVRSERVTVGRANAEINPHVAIQVTQPPHPCHPPCQTPRCCCSAPSVFAANKISGRYLKCEPRILCPLKYFHYKPFPRNERPPTASPVSGHRAL